MEAGEVIADILEAIEELHALVCGECPSLLNEDSGGDSSLDMKIRDAIDSGRRYQKEQK